MENSDNDKHDFPCVGGPLDGQFLRLTIDHPYTLVFNLKNHKGRYTLFKAGDWILHWEVL